MLAMWAIELRDVDRVACVGGRDAVVCDILDSTMTTLPCFDPGDIGCIGEAEIAKCNIADESGAVVLANAADACSVTIGKQGVLHQNVGRASADGNFIVTVADTYTIKIVMLETETSMQLSNLRFQIGLFNNEMSVTTSFDEWSNSMIRGAKAEGVARRICHHAWPLPRSQPCP
eukprot:TRINITY_DN11221_c0_g1_i3.p3 TRINITY_DN11221_c0_g1~~TRINITY_DN11221_c0_g1_i3.p3  ORF type:complete len:174 (-),score=20.37 TRINITY_DN11221_c0_g1_i3:2741-3262(-)